MAEEPVTVTAADILAAGEKLEEFRQSLAPNEQAALAWLMQKAAMFPNTTGPAQGYAIVFEQRGSERLSGSLPFRFETTWSLGEGGT